jgi:pilus assembly protein CpaF
MTVVELIATLPTGAVLERAVRGPEIWLGRDALCDLVLESELISRRHARLRVTAHGAVVTDQSANGTRVGEVLLRRASRAIDSGSELGIGPYRIRVAFQREVSSGPSAGVEHDRSTVRADHDLPASIRRRIQRRLIDHLDLARMRADRFDAQAMRPAVEAALRTICDDLGEELPPGLTRATLVAELTDEALGLGPLEALLADPSVSEIMVVDPSTIYVERNGLLEHTDLRFTDGESVRAVIERIVTPLGRRIDESTPLVDARLPDGSRVNAIIPPLASRGPCITIRKFGRNALSLDDLVAHGSLSRRMAELLHCAVRARKNLVIAGGTGSGKTTLLNVLSSAIPERERIVTIEDAAELALRQKHVVSLEARPANMEGKGAYSIRDLVRNALRMRPDRIVVGECRGGEAIDMLQAMNTGHEGSMTTTHANSPREAISRMETLCLMAGLELPAQAIRTQIAASVHLLVQQTRFGDGSRRVTSISEVLGLDERGQVEQREIFFFERTGTDAEGRVLGSFRASGYLPTFAAELAVQGLDCVGAAE